MHAQMQPAGQNFVAEFPRLDDAIAVIENAVFAGIIPRDLTLWKISLPTGSDSISTKKGHNTIHHSEAGPTGSRRVYSKAWLLNDTQFKSAYPLIHHALKVKVKSTDQLCSI